MSDINLPDVLAEVTAAFERYEAALTGNDVDTLDSLFWSSPHVVRYGATENLYGQDEIRAFRKARPSKGLDRTLRAAWAAGFRTVNHIQVINNQSSQDKIDSRIETHLRKNDTVLSYSGFV